MNTPNVLEFHNVYKTFTQHSVLKGRTHVHAVRGVNLTIPHGKSLALVGESGSGKSTIANLIVKHHDITDGTITVHGKDISTIKGGRDLQDYRAQVQIVSQDPFSALNPVHTIEHHLMRPLHIYNPTWTKQQCRERVLELLQLVELDLENTLHKYPHELSGGQRQRVNLARSIAVGANFIIADEPTSMLDVSIRKSVLDLMNTLKAECDVSFLYITHDIGTARYMADDIAILYLGQVVEWGNVNQVIDNPQHPYTKLLLSAIPDPKQKLSDSADGGKDFYQHAEHVRAVCSEPCDDVIDLGNGHYKLNHKI